MKYYKVKRSLDGLFSTGGRGPNIGFTNKGKLWRGIGTLRNHISMITGQWEKANTLINYPHPYEDCEIIELELVEINSYSAVEELLGCFERKKAQKEKQKRNKYH